ncbi:hypothetical protein F2Q68_00015714 [Brassica cretica]|uniref:Uncharacterized protein n=1 Tax=Brassica cretica TaxID=69181 RepID=A0A8S9HGE8_BRACR|nr:hypothetical protein F2Q68_00015714 [Brassica cretica]
MTSESTAHTVPASIDGDSYFRSTPLEIHEISSCPQDIVDSTHRSTDVSSCSPSRDVEKEITMEDFLEQEEFLELEDGEKLEDLDSIFEVEFPIPPDKDWGKEEEELEEEEKDQGRFLAIIDPPLLRWCQEIQSAQQMLLTAICKASSTPYC